MKITPIGAGSGAGAVLAQTGTQATSPDRKEAAKQAFLGGSPMKISPSDTPIDPQVEKAQANIRKIKMNTNASPEQYLQEAAPVEAPSVIPDASVQANPTTEVTQPISPQFAALARQRRALQVKESEIAKREAALTNQVPNANSIDIAKLKANPLSVLQDAGVTYEQLTDAILNNRPGDSPELQALRAKVDALEKGLDTKFSERDSQAEQQVLSEMKRQAANLVNNGDEYEIIKATESEPEIVELIHRTWKKTGEVLDVQEAADIVKDYLINESLRLAKLKSIQSKLTPAQEQQLAQQPQQQQAKQMRTLTNRDTATRPLSAKARAMAAFYGTLKK
jgi:hypothetical protein